jgi:hypothetical protein
MMKDLLKHIKAPAPLFRDPITDGAADPSIIWNNEENQWWILYTSRRATDFNIELSWIHGTDIGICSSKDGENWLYRGNINIEYGKGKNTFWAPEVIFEEGKYHMYVSYIMGVPVEWTGTRNILHFTSDNLWDWQYQSTLVLSSNYVIDACVHKLPCGGWRMWYKDEANDSHTWYADSNDLFSWYVKGECFADYAHEGPNIFYFEDYYWAIVDAWNGFGVYRSTDLTQWDLQEGRIMGEFGIRSDDEDVARHGDVLVKNGEAYIFYFTHPDKYIQKRGVNNPNRSTLQVARLSVTNGKLFCNRNEDFVFNL